MTDTKQELSRPEVAQALRDVDAAQAAVDANSAKMFEATRRAIAAREAGDEGAYASAMLDQQQAFDAGMELLDARTEAYRAVRRLTGSRFALSQKKDGSHSLRLTTWTKAR